MVTSKVKSSPANSIFVDHGVEFGTPVGHGTQHDYNTTDPTITINAINIDITNALANTMDGFTNLNGELITGHYDGPMGLIYD